MLIRHRKDPPGPRYEFPIRRRPEVMPNPSKRNTSKAAADSLRRGREAESAIRKRSTGSTFPVGLLRDDRRQGQETAQTRFAARARLEAGVLPIREEAPPLLSCGAQACATCGRRSSRERAPPALWRLARLQDPRTGSGVKVGERQRQMGPRKMR